MQLALGTDKIWNEKQELKICS